MSFSKNMMLAFNLHGDEVEKKKMSALMETAACWHAGQASALYSLVSTEKVHTEQHREELLAEIEGEIADLTADNYVKTETFSTEEIESLNDLRLFVKAFDLDDSISATQEEIDEMLE